MPLYGTTNNIEKKKKEERYYFEKSYHMSIVALNTKTEDKKKKIK
jgi:hypothetical protein